jgi:hypothetical protein
LIDFPFDDHSARKSSATGLAASFAGNNSPSR